MCTPVPHHVLKLLIFRFERSLFMTFIQNKKFLSYIKPFSFLPAIMVMCLIFSFSSQNGTESGSLSHSISLQIIQIGNSVFHQDLSDRELEHYADRIEIPVRKLAHMTEYCVFSLTILFPLYLYGVRGKHLLLFTLVFCVCFAASDEFHQSFVAGRGPSIKDVLIDSIGGSIGTTIGYRITKYFKRRSHK